jgi:hypothetical protein
MSRQAQFMEGESVPAGLHAESIRTVAQVVEKLDSQERSEFLTHNPERNLPGQHASNAEEQDKETSNGYHSATK